MKQTQDYYKILEVWHGAGKADIASAYRRLCKLYHPDINHDPDAEDVMKRINIAYYTLADDMRREAYNSELFSPRGDPKCNDDARSNEVMADYFRLLLNGSFDRAYGLLSEYDRQYVTLQSFTKWRSSVSKLFAIREFDVRPGEPVSKITLEGGQDIPAKKHYIAITEKNLKTAALESYHIAKFTVAEDGEWRVFLGYRDLNEIAKMFERLSVESERDEKERLWQLHCAETCRELGIPNLEGLARRAAPELYRHKRYGQPITLARYSITLGGGGAEAAPDILERAAAAITSSLRETDIPAYAGDGTFIVLFAELKKKHAEAIIARLADTIRNRLHDRPGCGVSFAHLPYSGGDLSEHLSSLREKPDAR